jgi:hypothetical protein
VSGAGTAGVDAAGTPARQASTRETTERTVLPRMR